ncbi:MAG: phage major capsid protein [Ruminococcus sp.]|nr:phage major capsid protein [Ruminococcus sp.]
MTETQKLLTEIQSLIAAAKSFKEQNDNEKYEATMTSIESKKAEYETAKKLEADEKFLAAEQAAKVEPVKAAPEVKAEEPVKVTAIKAFADAARHGFKKDMSEGTNADGGYTVPEDIVTKIYELRTAKASLLDLVGYETVTTNKGARTYKTRATQTGFTLVPEGTSIPKGNTPQFARLTYNIKKYGGYFPVTNELLADSDENIVGILTGWIADESRVTANKLVLAAIAAGWDTPTNLTNLDGIKNALNVTLGQAFKGTSRIVTNDDGLQYLDTLKDENGRYLLTPDISNPGQMRLSVGATTVPVTVIPNADLPTTDGKTPFIVGDFKEAIRYFDRKKLSIMSSNTATAGDFNAFEMDLTLFRALEREDVVVRDTAALVNGYISVG